MEELRMTESVGPNEDIYYCVSGQITLSFHEDDPRETVDNARRLIFPPNLFRTVIAVSEDLGRGPGFHDASI